MKYVIFDVCEDPSPAIYATELGKELTFERWLELLMLEVEAYCDCYYNPSDPKDMREMIETQFKQNLTEALTGKPIQINGMEFWTQFDIEEN